MERAISIVLAKNEALQLTGPGAVQVATSSSVAISGAKTAALAKGGVTAGILTTSVAPIIGLVILVGGLTLMAKMAGDYAATKK
ncbi:MAG: hypothetical protein HQL69_04870 [Magnetococcales bacterium]|nr:hypothetical protein [Magnetococcales bacterium]